MSDFTIRTSTTPPATIKVQLDPSQSVAEAVAAADAAAASKAAAAASEAAAAGSAAAASTSATSASSSASAAASSATAADASADAAAASAADAAATLDASLKKADNLSDLANAATARTNLGVPPSTRTISAGTGLTGGGDLSADRSISASIASQSEAEAGTSSTVLMTPERTERHMLANAVGWGQTWQGVLASRAANTSYQNTTGRPIQVNLRWSASGVAALQVSPNNSTWVDVARNAGGGDAQNASAIVPNGWYYRTNTAVGFAVWAELR